MAFNGSGTFNRLYNWVTDRDNNVKILASKMDQEMDGFATGLSNCITKNGESTIISNLSLNNYKLTGLANGSSRTDSINIGQVQDGTYTYLGTTSGSADAYTLAPSPTITAYATTQQFTVKIHATNTTTTPYLQISAIANPTTTAVIKKLSATKTEIALEAGDLIANGLYKFQRNSANDAWIVLNPEKSYYNLLNATKATSTSQGIVYLPLPVDPITAGINSTTPNTDVDFFAGTMTLNDNSAQVKATAMTKRLQSTGSWTAGNNGNGLLSGARANSSTYHWFALYKASDNSVDYGCILGVAGTTPDPTSVLPSDYSKYQYIFSVLTDASGNIRRGSYSFRLDGSYTCEYNTYIENRALSAAPTTPTLLTLTVPLGLKVISKTFVYFEYAVRAYFLLIDPAKTTTLSTGGHFNYSGIQTYSSNAHNAPIETLTDNSGRVSIVASLANQSQIITTGFIYNPINR